MCVCVCVFLVIVDLKQNGLVMTEELKEQLEDAAAATSKAYAHVRTLGTTEAASESDILNLGQGALIQNLILFSFKLS